MTGPGHHQCSEEVREPGCDCRTLTGTNLDFVAVASMMGAGGSAVDVAGGPDTVTVLMLR